MASLESVRDGNGRHQDEARTILVVEDEQPVRALAARILARRGYTVLQAPDGNAAIQVIEDNHGDIDVVLCDVVMPGISGSELAKHVKKRIPEAGIVFMSGYTAGVLDLELGPRDVFVSKPLSPGRLARALREVLDRQREAGTR